MTTILPKTWTAGDQVLASDLNGNFTAILAGTYTMGEDITANDSVYVSAADTVKKIGPTSITTPTSVSTSPTTISGVSFKNLYISNGVYLSLGGGVPGSAISLDAQVRTMNAAETDFSNGSAVAVQSSTAVYDWDVCWIDTNTAIAIYLMQTAGSPAGIKARVISISGTTVSVGTQVTIETTGTANDTKVSVAKVDTLKALITYQRDSDQNIMVQVLTVSGTTITTNTAVVAKAQGNILRTLGSTQLATNTVLIAYAATSNVFGRTITISGTTPTVNSEQTLVSGTSGSTSVNLMVEAVSSTRAVFTYWDQNAPTLPQCSILTISGSTVTKGSDLALNATNSPAMHRASTVILSTKQALVSRKDGSSIKTSLLDISGATPTSTATVTSSITFGSIFSVSIVRVKPWLYYLTGAASDGDYVVPLVNGNENFRIGIAAATVASAGSGSIFHRYLPNNNLTGLTAGVRYYVDDNGQPTINSSLVAPVLGISLNATKIMLQ